MSELVSQLKFQIKNGASLRLMLKIGRIAVKSGNIDWKSLVQDDIMNKTADGFKLEDDYVYSQLRKELSVVTPSYVQSQSKSRAKSFINSRTSSNSYHMANPNPQSNNYKYKGIRDLGYTRYARDVDPTDIVKFGKKVYHGNSKMTNEEMMEFHLKQMRDKKNSVEAYNDQQRKQQLDFLNSMSMKEAFEQQKMQESRKIINDDFMEHNRQLVDRMKRKKQLQNDLKKSEQYNYFPYVAGDLIEQHRAALGQQLKHDL